MADNEHNTGGGGSGGGDGDSISETSSVSGGGGGNSPSSSHLDMEAVFFRLHDRLARFFATRMSRKSMIFFEFLALANALILLMLLCWFHYWYVARANESCLAQLLKDRLAVYDIKPDVVSLQVSGIWSRLESEDPSTAERIKTLPVNEALIGPQLFTVWLQDPVFIYSSERGFLMLDPETRRKHGVSEVSIKIDTEQDCVRGNTGPYERYLLDNFIGYDTVVLNALGAVYSTGFLYSVHSRELLNVDYAGARVNVATKLSAVTTTLFLFFITTTLVHHTLRETQERMLKFTFDLQIYVRRRLPYRNLVLNHVVGSLVFVPVVVGMLFFLFEFFNDQLLAFMVLTMVWVCELYSVITLRTVANVRVFPRLFFLYFCSFHMYVFLFPSGFTYMALTCCVMFLQHGMVSFFVRHEIPAIISGQISTLHPRDTCRELLPEEVQAGGASLAVRALVGVRDRVPPGIIAVAHPHLVVDGDSAGISSSMRVIVSTNTADEVLPAETIPTLSSSVPTPRRLGTTPPMPNVEGAFNARPARKKRTTITGGGVDDAPVTPTSLSNPRTGLSPTLGWVDDNVMGGNVVGGNGGGGGVGIGDDESSSTGWEIGGISS